MKFQFEIVVLKALYTTVPLPEIQIPPLSVSGNLRVSFAPKRSKPIGQIVGLQQVLKEGPPY